MEFDTGPRTPAPSAAPYSRVIEIAAPTRARPCMPLDRSGWEAIELWSEGPSY